MAYRVFISHSSRDTWVAEQIEAQIIRVGAETFLDERHIQFGDNFTTVIRHELNRANELLVLFTPWAVERDWIKVEIGVIWGRGERIIAVIHGITLREFQENSQIPSVTKENDIVEINELAQYFTELQYRIARRSKTEVYEI